MIMHLYFNYFSLDVLVKNLVTNLNIPSCFSKYERVILIIIDYIQTSFIKNLWIKIFCLNISNWWPNAEHSAILYIWFCWSSLFVVEIFKDIALINNRIKWGKIDNFICNDIFYFFWKRINNIVPIIN